MRRLFLVLLILFIAGILLIASTFWSFAREKYVDDTVLSISRPLNGNVDTEYLKKEMDPAYGY